MGVTLPILLLFVCIVQAQQYPSDEYDTDYWTNNIGAPVTDNDNSLTVGIRGPTLLEDYTLIEKLANFDRERIPERVVHAVGASAKGHFQVTGDVSDYTFADFLQPGKITPLTVRFSTVIPSRGSPETGRDPRGFAIKFYTQQGNYDLVGLNFPVFFIRDGMKFPDMIHSLKPNPVNNQQEWWRIWDFFSSHPESLHMFTHLLDDIGIPADYRHMDGHGVHTYKWISKAGVEWFVKYTLLSHQGVVSLINDDQVKNITNPGHATLDLYDHIKAGNFPKWTVQVQILDPKNITDLDFDPLDVTKTWPVDHFPLKTVGVLTLDENVDNYFTDTEQLAFSPSSIVPGIYYSDDKMLQARLFSYPDTQRYRLGGNYQLLPINAPRCPFHNNNRDGVMNFVHRTSEVNYFPSRVDTVTNAPAYPTNTEPLSGVPTRGVIPLTNNFKQAGARFLSFASDRQQRFIARLIATLAPPVAVDTRNIVIGYWSQADNTILGPALRKAYPTPENHKLPKLHVQN